MHYTVILSLVLFFFCWPARNVVILVVPQGITDSRLEVSRKSFCLFKPVTPFFASLLPNKALCTFLGQHMTSHDVTKIQTKKLSILPRFNFHDALEQLKTNFHTNFCFKRVIGFVIEYA